MRFIRTLLINKFLLVVLLAFQTVGCTDTGSRFGTEENQTALRQWESQGIYRDPAWDIVPAFGTFGPCGAILVSPSQMAIVKHCWNGPASYDRDEHGIPINVQYYDPSSGVFTLYNPQGMAVFTAKVDVAQAKAFGCQSVSNDYGVNCEQPPLFTNGEGKYPMYTTEPVIIAPFLNGAIAPAEFEPLRFSKSPAPAGTRAVFLGQGFTDCSGDGWGTQGLGTKQSFEFDLSGQRKEILPQPIYSESIPGCHGDSSGPLITLGGEVEGLWFGSNIFSNTTVISEQLNAVDSDRNNPARCLQFAEVPNKVCDYNFRFAWNYFGGLTVMGFPLGDVQPAKESPCANGIPFEEGTVVQCFERTRLERHADGSMHLGLLGKEQVDADAALASAKITEILSDNYVDEIFHTKAQGIPLLVRGFPITNKIQIPAKNGNPSMEVQYFERVRMEHHEGDAPNVIYLGLLGRERANIW